jgi:spore maturation protein CgeB
MKILFSAALSDYTDQLKKAFLDNKVELFNINERENRLVPPVLNKNEFLWRLNRRIGILRNLNNKVFSKDLIEYAKRIKPDILFIHKGMTIPPKVLLEMRSMGVRTANWFPDNCEVEPYDNWLKSAAPPCYDYFFSFDSAIIQQFPKGAKTQVCYMPFGVDLSYCTPGVLSEKDKHKFDANICFIGAFYPEREGLLDQVKDLGLKIFGWRGWEHSSLAGYFHGPLNIEQFSKAYSCAKISINTNSVPATNGVNQRTFEIPGAGGFQLSDYRKDVDGLFEIGKEIEVFRSETEFRDKIKYYLENEKLRAEVACAGYERVLRDHQMKDRVAKMLKIMSQ